MDTPGLRACFPAFCKVQNPNGYVYFLRVLVLPQVYFAILCQEKQQYECAYGFNSDHSLSQRGKFYYACSFHPFKNSSKTSSRFLIVVEVSSCLRGRNNGGGTKSCKCLGSGGGSSSFNSSLDFIRYMRAEESKATPDALKSTCPVFSICCRNEDRRYEIFMFHGVSFPSLLNSNRMFHGGWR